MMFFNEKQKYSFCFYDSENVGNTESTFRVIFPLLPISQDPFDTILPTIYYHCCILDDILIIFWDHNIFKDIFFLF